jgi:hypothetical protein
VRGAGVLDITDAVHQAVSYQTSYHVDQSTALGARAGTAR